MSSSSFRLISPVDGRLVAERPYHDKKHIEMVVTRAHQAQKMWRAVPLPKRSEVIHAFIEAFLQDTSTMAKELTLQMGRPIAQSPGEIKTTMERASQMTTLAPQGLANIQLPALPGIQRHIRREPLGVVFVVPAWNYPYLIAINSVVPALLAGNAVILKHSTQTALCADHFAGALEKAGLPGGLFQTLDLNHEDTAWTIAHTSINFVAFTGSVGGGHAITRAAKDRFIGVALELGGKDPAYVRADADLESSVENLVDGSFFNSGQSCCGIERIYVHRELYDSFVDASVEMTKKYRLGDPLDERTNLGPMAKQSGADFVRQQVTEAVAQGAKSLIDPETFDRDAPNTPYVAPRILVDVDHNMSIMKDETFGPVMAIQKVEEDGEAVQLMNDSPFGLTASVWTKDSEIAMQIGERLETGTVFLNRCDYLDPHLAWVGVKDSGRGCSLSICGYEQLTRPKSFHLRQSLTNQ